MFIGFYLFQQVKAIQQGNLRIPGSRSETWAEGAGGFHHGEAWQVLLGMIHIWLKKNIYMDYWWLIRMGCFHQWFNEWWINIYAYFMFIISHRIHVWNIYTNIYHKIHPNVGKYSIRGSYGLMMIHNGKSHGGFQMVTGDTSWYSWMVFAGEHPI